jgi:hypothetical protein
MTEVFKRAGEESTLMKNACVIVISITLALSILLSPALSPAQESGGSSPYSFLNKNLTLPSTAAPFEFHSNFWMNLHHFLYHLAEPKGGPIPRSPVLNPLGVPSEEERHRWEQAVGFYRQNIIASDVLFDAQMRAIKKELAAGENASSVGEQVLGDDLAGLLNRVAPIYRKYWWPTHDAANRLWIMNVEPLINALGARLRDQVAAAYETPWHPGIIRVDVSAYAGTRMVAYTTGTTQGHVVISSVDPCDQGYAALETVVHEESHTIVDDNSGTVGEAIKNAAKFRNVPPPDGLWHALMLYTDGELTRRDLAELGIGYEPSAGRCNVFTGRWELYRHALSLFWQQHLDGKLSLNAAVSKMVEALSTDASSSKDRKQ